MELVWQIQQQFQIARGLHDAADGYLSVEDEVAGEPKLQSVRPSRFDHTKSSQGYIKPFCGMDAAVKKSFLKNNAASITLSVTDIFRTRWSDQYSESSYFQQEYDRLKDPQLVRLVFAYRFGKMDLNLFKRKDMHPQGMGDAGSSLQ